MERTTHISVILVDDHPVVREGLKHMLTQTPEINVVGEASTAAQALNLLQQSACDIALIDIALPDQSGLVLLRALKETCPQVRTIMLSGFSENEYALTALRDGASGYVMKTVANEELVNAIRLVAAGGRYLSPSMIAKLGRDWIPGEISEKRGLFSGREQQILHMLAAGKRLTEIGNELHLSIKTISTYRARILEKTGLKNNAELVRYVLERELVS